MAMLSWGSRFVVSKDVALAHWSRATYCTATQPRLTTGLAAQCASQLAWHASAEDVSPLPPMKVAWPPNTCPPSRPPSLDQCARGSLAAHVDPVSVPDAGSTSMRCSTCPPTTSTSGKVGESKVQ